MISWFNRFLQFSQFQLTRRIEIIQSSIFSHCWKGEQNGCCGAKEKKVPRGEFLYFLAKYLPWKYLLFRPNVSCRNSSRSSLSGSHRCDNILGVPWTMVNKSNETYIQHFRTSSYYTNLNISHDTFVFFQLKDLPANICLIYILVKEFDVQTLPANRLNPTISMIYYNISPLFHSCQNI